jgi:hypothetical protein
MSGMPHSTNPVAIARETVSIAKESGSPAFEKAAKWTLIGSAVLTAVVGLLHAAKTLYRDLSPKPDSHAHGRNAPQPVPPDAGPAAETPPRSDGGHERSWVQKAKTADREPHARQARPAYREGQGHGGRH